MSRSPLAYPLTRSSDTDAGGAADLQTDIMRFMAILSMCLLAIFALVQSIPLAPVEATEPPEAVAAEQPAVLARPPEPTPKESDAASAKAETTVVLTRPVGGPSGPKRQAIAAEAAPTLRRAAPEPLPVAKEAPALVEPAPAPVEPEPEPEPEPIQEEGFTLRFASDAALMRAVAAQHVGLYAIEQGRARRMTVSESRISFWDASTPNTFHEMESGTVPPPVIEALGRAGAATNNVSWGVTLPGRMKTQLDELLHAHRGGSLIITADGDIHWEAS
jgi:hypothetical protein